MKKFKRGKNCKISKGSVEISNESQIFDNVVIHDNVKILGKSIIESDVEIFSSTTIKDSVVKKGAKIKSSDLDGCVIGENNIIGPFSRIRPGTQTEEDVVIGNFVEVKNSKIGKGTKACHLAYIGDCEIGENVNIGCGAIFVNYNGKIKQKSIVKDGAFIGSNCNIIAPVTIEDGAYVCAGTTITKDVKSNDLVIGRVRQEVKEGGATKFLK